MHAQVGSTSFFSGRREFQGRGVGLEERTADTWDDIIPSPSSRGCSCSWPLKCLDGLTLFGWLPDTCDVPRENRVLQQPAQATFWASCQSPDSACFSLAISVRLPSSRKERVDDEGCDSKPVMQHVVLVVILGI